MALIRWNPWSINRFFEDDWDLPTIPGISRIAGQGLNLYETEDAIVAEAAVPGISEDKIDVSVDEGIVRISATSEEKTEEKGKRRYFMTSMAQSYNYSFRLPQNVVSEEEPKAELDNGVLKLSFMKVKKAPPKKVKVTAKPKSASNTAKAGK